MSENLEERKVKAVESIAESLMVIRAFFNLETVPPGLVFGPKASETVDHLIEAIEGLRQR